ncbi:hypothetical protein D3C87_24320 [compost metagenome]
MADTFHFSEKDRNNIFDTLNYTRDKIESNSLETLERIANDPVSFFLEAGMNQTIKNWFFKIPGLLKGFRISMKSLANNILDRLKNTFHDCQQCIIAMLYMLWVVRAALRNKCESYANFEDAFIELLKDSWIGQIILGSGLLAKGLIDPITKVLRFDWRPQRLAQYICYKVGICPNPYIYE